MQFENDHRILLIEPPFNRLFGSGYSLDRIPHGLLSLAGAILDHTTWEVAVYNADFCGVSIPHSNRFLTGTGFQNFLRRQEDPDDPVWRRVRQKIREIHPAVVGVSAKSPSFVSARMVARIAKELDPRVTVIVGGPHPSLPGVNALACTEFDFAVRGEGELTIIELLGSLTQNAPPFGVPGVSFRHNGAIVENEPKAARADLDRLRPPHEIARLALVDYAAYPVSTFRHVYTTRGCPFDCFFCGSREMWGRTVRFRSPERVVEEIEGLQKMGLRFVQFQDDTFGIDKAHLEKLCALLTKHCPGLRWGCFTHVNLVNDKVMSLMKAAGCESVHIGIESGNNGILRSLRKHFTIDEALNAAQIIKRAGLKVSAFFMVGSPEETEETLAETFQVIKQGRFDRVVYSVFTPHPGTEAFEYCKDRGLVAEPFDVSLYNHQGPENYFCSRIDRQRFRTLAVDIERMVDRANNARRIRHLFSTATVRRVRELEFRGSVVTATRWLSSYLKRVQIASNDQV